jgi:hypothetical protein
MKLIVLVHGFRVTPRSWEHWIAPYESKGHQVIAPGCPGFEVEVEAHRGRGDELGADRGRGVVPLSQLKSTLPVLKSLANRHKSVP